MLETGVHSSRNCSTGDGTSWEKTCCRICCLAFVLGQGTNWFLNKSAFALGVEVQCTLQTADTKCRFVLQSQKVNCADEVLPAK